MCVFSCLSVLRVQSLKKKEADASNPMSGAGTVDVINVDTGAVVPGKGKTRRSTHLDPEVALNSWRSLGWRMGTTMS